MFHFSINQWPSSLNNVTIFPSIRQTYRIPTPPAFSEATRRTSSTRSTSNTRPSSQVMALGRMLPSKSKSAFTCKFIFIVIASFLIANFCLCYYNIVFEKRKANKMKNPATDKLLLMALSDCTHLKIAVYSMGTLLKQGTPYNQGYRAYTTFVLSPKENNL